MEIFIRSVILLPAFHLPAVIFAVVENALPNAFTIAVLAAIESLLSCVVADGMINGKHRSDMELVAQGAGNIASALIRRHPCHRSDRKNRCQHQKWRTHSGCRNGALHYTGHRTRRTDAICRNDPNANHRSNPVYRCIQYVPVAYLCTLLIRTAPKSDIIVFLHFHSDDTLRSCRSD